MMLSSWAPIVAFVAAGWPATMLVWLAQLLILRRRGRSGRPEPAKEVDRLEFVRLLSIGVAGGLNLASALELAGRASHPSLRVEVAALLRRARTTGLAPALASAGGDLAAVGAQLARSQATGAPLGLSIDALVERLEHEVHARSLERIRTLPVRLVIPLTLLLLPGFVLVVVAPGVLEVMGDLGRGVFD